MHSEQATTLYSYMHELQANIIACMKNGSTSACIEHRKTLMRVTDRYRQLSLVK
jgi:hypothetical protein